MNKKNNKRYKAKNEKIENAFLSLLQNRKYEKITISEICETAEINRSTFYAHYDDINDLIIKIESKFANSMSVIFEYGMRWENKAFEEMFDFIKQNKYYYKAFLNIPHTTLAETNSKNSALSNIKDNHNLKSDSVTLFYRASFFGAGIKEICRIWLERDCKETPQQLANLLLDEYANRKDY